MMQILIRVKNYPVVVVDIDNTATGRLYFDLCKQHCNQSLPFYRDSSIYTVEYMQELAIQADHAFGWDWFRNDYNIAQTAQLHKDLEYLLGTTGFHNIPEQYDGLLYDLHHCLHAIQFGNPSVRSDYFQMEWLTDNSVDLPDDFEFVSTITPGTALLINPYVGHNPLQIYQENDWSNLNSTCKFHDIIKPAIVLAPRRTPVTISAEEILAKFQEQDPDFVATHGAQKILYYSGFAKIGQATDPDLLHRIYSNPDPITIENVEFIND